MNKCFVQFSIAVLLAQIVCAKEPVPHDFAYGNSLNISEASALSEFTIPLDVYKGVTRPDLGDMAIFNGVGEMVPFAILPAEGVEAAISVVDVPVFPVQEKEGAPASGLSLRVATDKAGSIISIRTPAGVKQRITSYILDASRIDKPIRALELEWQQPIADFMEKMRIEGSDDLQQWSTLGNDVVIASLHHNGNLLVRRTVELGSTRKAKYYRITNLNGEAAISVIKVIATVAASMEQLRQWITITARSEGQKPGEYLFDLEGQLPIDRIKFNFPEPNNIVEAAFYGRLLTTDQWFPLGDGILYRLQRPEGELLSPELVVHPAAKRYLLMRCERSSMGFRAGMPQLSLGFVPQKVVFMARGRGPFMVAYGSIERMGSQQTALIQMAQQQHDMVKSAIPGPRIILGGETSRTQGMLAFNWKKALLWSSLLAGVAFLAWMALTLYREMNDEAKPKEP